MPTISTFCAGDPAFKLACGRLPETDAHLCSQPTLSRIENAPNLKEAVTRVCAIGSPERKVWVWPSFGDLNTMKNLIGHPLRISVGRAIRQAPVVSEQKRALVEARAAAPHNGKLGAGNTLNPDRARASADRGLPAAPASRGRPASPRDRRTCRTRRA